MTVFFFGPLAELTGNNSIQIEDYTDTAGLQQALYQRFPALSGKKFAVAVNKAVVQQYVPLTAGSEVALLPPFSGG